MSKFFDLLFKKDGGLLEQVYSPLIVHTAPEREELKEICRAKISNTSPNPLPGRGGEGGQTGVNDADASFHQAEYERLRGELQAAHEASQLPEVPSEDPRAALNDLLVRIRLSR